MLRGVPETGPDHDAAGDHEQRPDEDDEREVVDRRRMCRTSVPVVPHPIRKPAGITKASAQKAPIQPYHFSQTRCATSGMTAMLSRIPAMGIAQASDSCAPTFTCSRGAVRARPARVPAQARGGPRARLRDPPDLLPAQREEVVDEPLESGGVRIRRGDALP